MLMMTLCIHNVIITSSTRWTEIRRVSLQCQYEKNCHLQFGMMAPTFAPMANAQTIISRGISTVPLHPNFPTQISDTPADATTTESATTTTTPSLHERNTLNYIRETQEFSNIYNLVSALVVCTCVFHAVQCVQSLNGSSIDALMSLNDLILSSPTALVFRESISFTAVAYLLSVIVNGLGNQTVEPVISEVCNETLLELSRN